MATHEDDQGLQVLHEIYDQQPRSIPFKVVQDFYSLQRQYQYETDREVPMAQIRSLVSVVADQELSEATTGGETAQ